MRKALLVVLVALWASGAVAGPRMTVEQERARFQTLLEYATTGDVPSRHTAHEEMVKFNQWIDGELLGRLSNAGIRERQLFWTVLHDRGCRKALGPALKMLPEAVQRCREAQIAAYEIHELRRKIARARRTGNNAVVDGLEQQIAGHRPKVQWTEVQQGDEIGILCAIASRFGHERAFKLLMTIATDSSTDDVLAKGSRTRRTRTHRDRPLPGGTEMWNLVYAPVWQALRELSRRPMKEGLLASARKKFFEHFEKLEKGGKLGPNQESAVGNFHLVQNALLKTKDTRGEEDGTEEKEDDDGVGIIKM